MIGGGSDYMKTRPAVIRRPRDHGRLETIVQMLSLVSMVFSMTADHRSVLVNITKLTILRQTRKNTALA